MGNLLSSKTCSYPFFSKSLCTSWVTKKSVVCPPSKVVARCSDGARAEEEEASLEVEDMADDSDLSSYAMQRVKTCLLAITCPFEPDTGRSILC